MQSALNKLLLGALWSSHDGLAEMNGREIVVELDVGAITHLVNVQPTMTLCLSMLRRLDSGETATDMRKEIRAALGQAMGAFNTLEGTLTRKPGGQPVVIDHSAHIARCLDATRALDDASQRANPAAGPAT